MRKRLNNERLENLSEQWPRTMRATNPKGRNGQWSRTVAWTGPSWLSLFIELSYSIVVLPFLPLSFFFPARRTEQISRIIGKGFQEIFGKEQFRLNLRSSAIGDLLKGWWKERSLDRWNDARESAKIFQFRPIPVEKKSSIRGGRPRFQTGRIRDSRGHEGSIDRAPGFPSKMKTRGVSSNPFHYLPLVNVCALPVLGKIEIGARLLEESRKVTDLDYRFAVIPLLLFRIFSYVINFRGEFGR